MLSLVTSQQWGSGSACAQPAYRCEHRGSAFERVDLGRFRHEHRSRRSSSDEVRVLVHGQDRHPVRRIV